MLAQLLLSPAPRRAGAVWVALALAGSSVGAQRERLSGPGAEEVDRFAQEIAAVIPRQRSVGVLPMAFFPSKRDPLIAKLGVTLGVEVADALEGAGFKGLVLNPREMVANLIDLNLDVNARPMALYRLQDVLSQGYRLGVDVIVFGTIERPDESGFGGPLEIEIIAADVLNGREFGSSAQFEVPNKSAFKRTFAELDEDRAWVVAKTLPDSGRGDLAHELKVAIRLLSDRIARQPAMATADESKQVYVAPADSSRFVGGMAELSTLLNEFRAEEARRNRLAQSAGPDDPDYFAQPFVLGDFEFQDMQAARNFVTQFRKDLQSSETFRFSETIAKDMVEFLRPKLDPRVVINDLSFLRVANPDDVENQLLAGGIANNKTVHRLLATAGVNLVVQPRLERVGENFQLRTDVYDMDRGDFLLSSSFPIDGRYSADLAARLDVVDAGGRTAKSLEPVDGAARLRAWDELYEDVKTGVMQLVGQGDGFATTGTGFVVAADLVMTNSHVVGGLREANRHFVVLHDGRRVPIALDVVEDDAFLDVAVVRVSGLPEGTHVFTLAPEERARRGVEVAALGYPKNTDSQVFTPGFLTSTEESVRTTEERPRPSYMYSSLTRSGSSGSPVMLRDGTVIAVNSHGALGDVTEIDRSGNAGQLQGAGGSLVLGELPGFARGARSLDAAAVLQRARAR